jgi:hypothetical protein
MYIKKYRQIDVTKIKNRRFTNWFWHIHRTKEYAKIDLLRIAYEDEPYVKRILYYCYNTEFKLNLSPIKILQKDKCKQSDYRGMGVSRSYKTFLSILDRFIGGETTKKQTYAELYTLYTLCNRYTRWVFNRVLDRDMLIGADIKTLRKHFPDLFTNFSSENWKPLRNIDAIAFPVLVTGIRGERTLLISKDRYYSIKTAQGYDVAIDETFQVKLPKEVVLEGVIEVEKEHIIKTIKPKYKYDVVGGKFKRCRGKRKRSTIIKFIFSCFDYIPLSEFEDPEKELVLSERIKIMRMLKLDGVKFLSSKIATNKEELITTIKNMDRNKILVRELNKKYGDGCYVVYKKFFIT